MRLIIKRTALLLLISAVVYSAYLSTRNLDTAPALQDADLVFQTSWTPQSLAIGLATASLYIHMGIIKHTDHGIVVIEAASTVRETPLKEWIERGILQRFSLYRYRGITQEQAQAVLEKAKTYYGRPYNHYFSFDSDDIYCSELVLFSFRDAGLEAPKPEKIGTLYINNPFSKALINERWKNYPACKGKDITFDQCYDIIMNSELISPARIASDPHMERIFTNYP
jgi:hypothetical protein